MPRSRSPEDSGDEYYKKKKKKKSKSKDREKRSRSRERSRDRSRDRSRERDKDKEKKHKDKKHKDKKHKRDKSESPELTPAEKFSIFKKQREAAGKGENIVVDDMFKDFISAKLKQIQTDTASIPNNEEDSKSKKKSSVEEMKKLLDSELSSINSAPVKQELDTKISDHKKTENKQEVSKSSANVTAIKQEPTESNNSKNSVNGATSVQSNISDKVKVESGVAAIPIPMPRPKPPASDSDAVFTMAPKPIMKPVMGFGSMLPRTLAVKEEKKEETSTEKKESESDGKKPALGFKNFGIKLSLTSTELIQSGAQFKKGKRLEDGEVLSSSDSDGSKSSDTEPKVDDNDNDENEISGEVLSSSDSDGSKSSDTEPEVDDNDDDENEISGTGSINDSDDETKVKKKKKKKKKGKHKKKKSKEKEKEKEKEEKEDVLVVGPDKPGEKRKVSLGSRSRSKSPKKSKQSRSISKERTNRSPSKEKSSKSKDRSKRSRSKEKSKRSRSKDRSKRSRSRDKSKRSRSRERSKKNRSRSNSRSRKRRSRSRSKGRRSRSRDRRSRERSSRKGRSRSRSKDRRRSRSRSPFKPWRSSRYGDFDAYRFSSSRKPKSRSVTPDKESDKFKERERKRLEDLRCKIDKAKLREIAMKNALESAKTTGTEVAVTIKAGGKSVAELTEYCKKITDQEKAKRLARGEEVSSSDEDVSGLYPNSDDDDAQTFKAREPGAIVMDIKNAKQLPLATPQERLAQAGQLRLQFPVSSGSQHRDKEWVPVEKPEPVKPTPGSSKSLPFPAIEHKVFEEPAPAPNVDISSIVSERLNAVRKLQENPHDFAAKQILSQAQQKASQWAQSKHLPGQFLGSTGASVMSQEELIGNKKRQAWIKKDVFTSAAPVTSGIGMFLLKKMGWKHGEGLGKNNEGQKEPLMLDFKVDRKGLVTTGEGKKGAQAQKVPKVTIAKDLSGKHPVSALGEFCNRRKWGIPRYELVHESGPSHKKDFCFKVLVNGAWYQPQISSNNKKLAKAAAATTCLQELGMVPREQT